MFRLPSGGAKLLKLALEGLPVGGTISHCGSSQPHLPPVCSGETENFSRMLLRSVMAVTIVTTELFSDTRRADNLKRGVQNWDIQPTKTPITHMSQFTMMIANK